MRLRDLWGLTRYEFQFLRCICNLCSVVGAGPYLCSGRTGYDHVGKFTCVVLLVVLTRLSLQLG